MDIINAPSYSLAGMKEYYDQGTTRSWKFRVQQLRILKKAILANELAFSKALFTDLKKSREEAYATEIGLLIAELNVAIRKLASWMEPERVKTNLVNLPSSSKIYHDPLGVVLIIAPWNYPLQLLLIPLVGAIAGGNCVVLKPSELAPATAAIIEKVMANSFTPDYIKVVLGDGAKVVPELMSDFRFDHIFYTGSTAVGRSIYKQAAHQLIPVTLELGGKSPAIVHSDANIQVAARRIVIGKFLNAGQTCIAPDYVLAQEDIKAELIAAMIQTIKTFYGTDAATSNDYAKIINQARFNAIKAFLDCGTLVYGGKIDSSELYIEPTILDDVSPDASIMAEEIFGPVLPVISFKTINEARTILSKHPNPLAFYLFTMNKSIQKEWIENTAFGGGCINNADWHFANHHLPFGGVGESGMGTYHGKYSFYTFTRKKAVMKTPNWFDPAIKYPPMTGRLWLFKYLFRGV